MRGEAGELAVSSGEIATGALSPEKQQEQELMGKLAATGKLPARPASSFLQKKLQQRVGIVLGRLLSHSFFVAAEHQ